MKKLYLLYNYQNILFSLLILNIFINCDKTSYEQQLLKKKDPIGFYGKTISKNNINELESIFFNPDSFLNKEVLTKGIILEVCPMRGCWINISDPNYPQKTLRVKVVDGEIVFPLSSRGKNALVQGFFDKIEFSYEQAKNWKIHLNEEKGISVNPDSINIEAEDLIEYRIIGNGIQIF